MKDTHSGIPIGIFLTNRPRPIFAAVINQQKFEIGKCLR